MAFWRFAAFGTVMLVVYAVIHGEKQRHTNVGESVLVRLCANIHCSRSFRIYMDQEEINGVSVDRQVRVHCGMHSSPILSTSPEVVGIVRQRIFGNPHT